MSRIGELLVREKMLSLQQLQQAQDEAKRTGKRLGATLARLGYVDDQRLTQFVAKQYSLPSINLSEIEIDQAHRLVTNAGIIRPAAGEQVDEAQFDEQFDINVKGVFYSIQKALPLLRDGGSIVLVSSIAHLKALDAHVVYAATKAAVRSFARSWAGELRQRNIRVNCLSPGPVLTPIIGKMGIGDEQFAAFERQVAGQIPLGRLGRPEELANAALFLASDDSSFITGIDLCVDGGLSQL